MMVAWNYATIFVSMYTKELSDVEREEREKNEVYACKTS